MGNKRKISHENIPASKGNIHQSQGKRFLWGEENSFRLPRADSALAFVEHTSTLRAPPWEAAVIFVCLWEKHAAEPELAARLGVFSVSSLPLQSGCKPHASLIVKTGQNLSCIQRSTQGREGPVCAKKALKSGEPPWAEKVVVNSRLQLAENCFDQLGAAVCCWTCSRGFLAEDFTWVLRVKNIWDVWRGCENWKLSLVFATPWTGAYQAPPSMGFSRQEHWSGLPFPSPEAFPHPGIEPRSPEL